MLAKSWLNFGVETLETSSITILLFNSISLLEKQFEHPNRTSDGEQLMKN